MLKKHITLVNKLGLHARATMKLLNLAERFESEINIEYAGKKINAKDILSMMSCGATKGTDLHVIVEGQDEVAAMAAVEKLIQDRFGEAE